MTQLLQRFGVHSGRATSSTKALGESRRYLAAVRPRRILKIRLRALLADALRFIQAQKVWQGSRAGYTIPELLVVLLLTGFFSSLILFFGFSYWRYGSLLEADQETLTTRLNVSDYLRDNLGTSSGLIIQNSFADSNTHNPDPDIGSNLYWAPLHAVPGSTAVGSTGTTPLLYFKRLSFDSTGAVIMNGTSPYEDEFVIFIDNPTKEMRVRSLANPDAPGNRLQTSCPAPLATNTCPADKIIARDLSSIDLQYFSRSGNVVDHTSLTDPDTGEFVGPDFTVVEVIEVGLHIAKKPLLQKTTATINEVVIRLALRNI